MRFGNTKSNGGGWTAAEIEAVWRRGFILPNYDPAVWRKDACGWPIKRSEYGTETQYGWEIDHIQPVSRGGTDHLANLQPLQWKNNRHKGDDWPNWSCAVA